MPQTLALNSRAYKSYSLGNSAIRRFSYLFVTAGYLDEFHALAANRKLPERNDDIKTERPRPLLFPCEFSVRCAIISRDIVVWPLHPAAQDGT
jgi:hypothetical protein